MKRNLSTLKARSPLRSPLSGEMPRVEAPEAAQVASPESAMLAQQAGSKRRISLRMIAIIICLLVIGGITVMNVLAQTTPPLVTTQRTMATGRATVPVPVPTPTASPQGLSFDWVPMQLPDGWTNARLQTFDALQALRTGVSFTDREMNLDYRSVGTRANHGGTLVAATFLLTPQAVTRFTQNDVRVVNNMLFDMIQQTKLVRVVVNPQPQLVKFAQSGQQQFAWVDVAFQLWQSKLVGGQRIDGKVVDATTNQPQIHHLIVLLLHVPVLCI